MTLKVFVLFVYLNIACFRMSASTVEFEFKLYTRDNPLEPYGYEFLLGKLKESLKKKIKVIIPGNLHSYDSIWVQQMRNNYLKVEDCNVIILQWSRAHWFNFFFLDATYLKAIGKELGKYFESLQRKNLVNFNNVHFIGHGFGGHIAGLAGAHLAGKIGRITALDPRIYRMSSIKTRERINSTNGIFVDVIHTCWSNYWWHSEAATLIGHADFYPNGGLCAQPGCPHELNAHQDSCAHKRTHKIMRESILNFGSFIATKCSSWINHEKKLCENETRTCAGENAKSDSRGMYFFHTNKMSPFALEANASEVYIVNMDFDEIN